MQLYRVWWKQKKKRGCQRYKLWGRVQHYKYMHPYVWICINISLVILFFCDSNEYVQLDYPVFKRDCHCKVW